MPNALRDEIRDKILDHLEDVDYRPKTPEKLRTRLGLDDEPRFKEELDELIEHGDLVINDDGKVDLGDHTDARIVVGSYRHNPRGFGFVVVEDPAGWADIFIPPGHNDGALSGDQVKVRAVYKGQRNGEDNYEGEIIQILERLQSRFPGTLLKHEEGGRPAVWYVEPDGTTFTDPILTPDAAGRHVKPGTKVVVEITRFGSDDEPAKGVITEVLGQPGEKDVDLLSVIAQFGLPTDFPEAVKNAASDALRNFDVDAALEDGSRLDLTEDLICTIDPPDAKDYDDAISVYHNDDGTITLGVHIADVSTFVPVGGILDEEAKQRGNSTYFPGHVIPMLPEVLSNGVCSLQGGVERFAKSVFITLEMKKDGTAVPVSTAFSNSVIKSAIRMRYIEAQAIIDEADVIPHPDGDRTIDDYDEDVVDLLHDMDELARAIQKRRKKQGQINLALPAIDLVLDEEGKVTGTEEEDDSYTHTIIEMFMVEANEAAARLYDKIGVPYLRRTHPGPDGEKEERLRKQLAVAGHQMPVNMDRQALQSILAKVQGKPEEFAINFAILRSIGRAEYSPKSLGHFALGSDNYSHFTSPIRRYADLTVHRLLDSYFNEIKADFSDGPVGPPTVEQAKKLRLDAPSYDELVEIGRHISFTERRSESAERELKQVKVLALLEDKIGEDYDAVITSITNHGAYVQIGQYLIEGLVRYEDFLDDWWDADPKAGTLTGQRSKRTVRVGDVVTARVIQVEPTKRELKLAVTEVRSRGANTKTKEQKDRPDAKGAPKDHRTGKKARDQRSKSRDRRKKHHRRDAKK